MKNIKTRSIYAILTAVVLIFVFQSCKKDDSGPDYFTVKSFPLNVGNWWKYKVTDLYYHKSDTELMKIVSVKENLGYKTFTCYFLDSNEFVIDSAFIKVYPNEIISNTFLEWGISYFGSYDLHFPLISGDSIISDSFGNKTKVISFSPGYNHFGKLYDVYTIESYSYWPNGSYNQTTLISKDIGIIQTSYGIWSMGPLDAKLFELIDYKLY
jgi:hypothetical protein